VQRPGAVRGEASATLSGDLVADCLPELAAGEGEGLYLHELRAPDALCVGAAAAAAVSCDALNPISQLARRLGGWLSPFWESAPKFFGSDAAAAGAGGVCMAGHRDCVGIAQCCLQLIGHKVLFCDAEWAESARLVAQFGGEGEPDAGAAAAAEADEGVAVPLGGAGLSARQVELLRQVASVGVVAPGDIAIFHAANYHAAANEAGRFSAACYTAYVPWAGLRRLAAAKDLHAGADDWVPAAELLRPHAGAPRRGRCCHSAAPRSVSNICTRCYTLEYSSSYFEVPCPGTGIITRNRSAARDTHARMEFP
jgi:hypothetical protein